MIKQTHRVNQVLFRRSLEKKNLTMAALARRLTKKGFRTCGSAISRWNSGHSAPASPAKMTATAKILAVPCWRLFPKLKPGEVAGSRKAKITVVPKREKIPAELLPLFEGTGVDKGGPVFALDGDAATEIVDGLQKANEALALEIGKSIRGVDDNATACLHAIQVAKKYLAAVPRK